MFKIEKEDKEKIVRTIRFSKEIDKRIVEEAKRNKISISKFVVKACTYALDNMEKK